MDAVKELMQAAQGTGCRQIIIKQELLSEKQKCYLKWQRCYEGKLFDDHSRTYKWGTQADFHGNEIDRDRWKPLYVPSIAKDMVKTLSSYLVGKDKFPTINITSPEHCFEALEIPPGYENDKAAGQAKAQGEALRVWARAVLDQVDMVDVVRNALREALVKEDSAVLVRYFGGYMWATVPDRTWCSWSYSEKDGKTLDRFTEMFFFKRHGVTNEDGSDKEFVFFRQLTATDWIEHEIPLEPRGDGKTGLGTPIVIFDGPHGFDFCPVTAYENVDCESIYANEVLENIKGHIEGCNDVKAGIRKNAQPQWVLLKESGDSGMMAGMPGADEDSPLKSGKLWELEGRSVQSFANGTDGYEMAVKDLENERFEIRSSANIIDIPADNEQSGRALALRLSPHYSAIDQLRGSIERSIKETVTKVLKGAMTRIKDLVLDDGIPRPRQLKTFTVSLDWGGLMPVTPEVIKQELENMQMLKDLGYMSQKSGMEYSLPLVNIDDIDAEMRQLDIEREKSEENAARLAEAAFGAVNDDDDDEEDDDG